MLKFAESHPEKITPWKEKRSWGEKQKPQAEWKEEKKTAVPAPEEKMDDCKQVLTIESKAEDPFAHLSKNTFVLVEFKCKWSNEETLSVVLPYVWEHFAKDGWSLCYSEDCFPESSPRPSWAATSPLGCSRGWTNQGRMFLPVSLPLEPTIAAGLGLLRPGSCFSVESRLAGGLRVRVIYMAETGSWQWGESKHWFQSLFPGRRTSIMWAKHSVRERSLSEHLLPSPIILNLSFREIGISKGNWTLEEKERKEHYIMVKRNKAHGQFEDLHVIQYHVAMGYEVQSCETWKR